MIKYEEDWLLPLLFKLDGSVAVRASMFAVPSAAFSVFLLYCDEMFPGRREELGMFEINGSQIWNATTGVLAILLAFRTAQAFSRFWEGTGLLHQMRGEWFDTVSNCVTFSIAAKEAKPKMVMEFRHTLVRLMSLCHGSSLEEIAGDSIKMVTIDVLGLDNGTLNHLSSCAVDHKFNKVEVMLHLIQSLITRALDDGVLKIPPPIASRVYQTISRGFVNLLNAKKITDTRFPFPYAQLITFLLFIHTVLTPMIISGLVESKVLCAIFSFIPLFGMFSLNFIAAELENPFGTDANDLPLEHFQEEMNSCLLMLLHDNTDMIANASDRCVTDFHELLGTMRNAQPDGEKKAIMRLGDALSGDNLIEENAVASATAPSVTPATAPAAAPATAPAAAAAAAAPATPLDKSCFSWVPAPAPNPKATDPQSRLVSNMEDFAASLQKWTTLLDENSKQMGKKFDALHIQSVNLAGLLKQPPEGWEAAVSPVP